MANEEHRNSNRNDQNASGGVEKGPTYGPHSVDTWGVSKIEEETFSFLWSLENYSAFKGAKVLRSPIFRGGPITNHSWQLQIYPKKKIGELEYFEVDLLVTAFGDGDTSPNRKVKARCQISLLDADGRPGRQGFSDSYEFKKSNWLTWPEFILSTDLISPRRRLKERLADDFGKLFKDAVMTDITVTTDNSTFMAHKNVLAARSPVFAAMFNTNMVEKESNTVEIPDFEDDIVKAMLEYLYTGETQLLHERAPDLLQVAEKYHLTGLKEACEYTISHNINVENAAQILVLAHMYNGSLLKPRVMDYINCNKEAVGKTDSFVQITQTHPNVIAELYVKSISLV